MPLFWAMVVLNYIDRTNLAFASIQLTADLGFDSTVRGCLIACVFAHPLASGQRALHRSIAEKHCQSERVTNLVLMHCLCWPRRQVYGLGSGLFFCTYATLQVPSNIVLRRVGGPKWLAAMIAGWGACAVAFAFMRSTTHVSWAGGWIQVVCSPANGSHGRLTCSTLQHCLHGVSSPIAMISSQSCMSHTNTCACATRSFLCCARCWAWRSQARSQACGSCSAASIRPAASHWCVRAQS